LARTQWSIGAPEVRCLGEYRGMYKGAMIRRGRASIRTMFIVLY
jgi:hypothetical protein